MKLGILLLSLGIATAAQAEDGKVICTAASDYAKSVMEARQNSVPPMQALKMADLVPVGSRDIAIGMIKAAYEVPVFDQAEGQMSAITGFTEDVLSECMSSYSDG